VKAAGGRAWSPYYRDVDKNTVAEAHRLGLQVIVWTVNDPKDIADQIDLGVDGIISDRPDTLRRVAAEKGFPLPKATPVTP
jgi:glycerophosphoryl diester phosphodiesterase